MKKFLTIFSLVSVVLLTGCASHSTPQYSSIAEAELIGKEYIDVVCEPMLNDNVITDESIFKIREVAERLNNMLPVENNYGNDWLKFDILAEALNTRADALETMVGSEITAEDKTGWAEQCDYIYSTYVESFKDFK